MLIFLLQDLMGADANLESIGPQIVQLFAQTLIHAQPTKAPSFAYSWLEIIAHRSLIHNFLVRPATKVSHHPSLSCSSRGLLA
jgi:CCR4-NOT transcription complex subunit 1